MHATTKPNHHLDRLFILHVGTHQVQEGLSADDEDADDAASQEQKTFATEKGALKVREKKRLDLLAMCHCRCRVHWAPSCIADIEVNPLLLSLKLKRERVRTCFFVRPYTAHNRRYRSRRWARRQRRMLPSLFSRLAPGAMPWPIAVRTTGGLRWRRSRWNMHGQSLLSQCRILSLSGWLS